MALERWGTLSVRDHLDLQGLVANVILYDRLVIPVPAGEPEVLQWRNAHWDPDLLSERIGQLGDLAVPKTWNRRYEEQFANKVMNDARAVEADVAHVMASDPQYRMQVTREILAQEKQLDLPDGVTRLDVVPAFNSESDFRELFDLRDLRPNESMTMVLRNKLAIPGGFDPESALERAIGLSMDNEFRNKRRDFYEWQKGLLAGNVSPQVIAQELREHVEGFNMAVEKATEKVDYKYVFMLGGVAVAMAGAFMNTDAFAAIGALITYFSFLNVDGTPVVDPGPHKPAAMFHDAEKLFER